MYITLQQFVTWYWDAPDCQLQNSHSGKPFTVQQIMEDCDMTEQQVTEFITYCTNKGKMTADQLIALNPAIVQGPFGLVINDPTTLAPGANLATMQVATVNVGDLTNYIVAAVVKAMR